MSERTWMLFTRVVTIIIVAVIALVLFGPWLLFQGTVFAKKLDGSLRMYAELKQGASHLQFTYDGLAVVLIGSYSNVDVRSVRNGKIIHRFEQPGATIYDIAVHPEKPLVAIGERNGLVWLWDYESNVIVNTFTIPTAIVSSVAISPDGTYLAAGAWFEDGNGTIQVWRIEDSALVLQLNRKGRALVEFTHDSKHVISTHPFEIWNIEDGSSVKPLTMGFESWHIAVSNNAPYMIASNYDAKDIFLWDQQDNRLAKFASRLNYNCGIAISDDGRFVASAPCLPATREHSTYHYHYTDQSIRIWNRADGRLLQEIKLLAERDVYYLAFSPDASMIAAGSRLSMSVWRVSPDTAAP
jgi:WD40 repeat protein